MRAWNQSVTTSGAFGGGPRLCPGRYLAAQSAKQVLAAVLGPEGFNWKLKEDQKLQQEYSPGLFPIDGLMLELSWRILKNDSRKKKDHNDVQKNIIFLNESKNIHLYILKINIF